MPEDGRMTAFEKALDSQFAELRGTLLAEHNRCVFNLLHSTTPSTADAPCAPPDVVYKAAVVSVDDEDQDILKRSTAAPREANGFLKVGGSCCGSKAMDSTEDDDSDDAETMLPQPSLRFAIQDETEDPEEDDDTGDRMDTQISMISRPKRSFTRESDFTSNGRRPSQCFTVYPVWTMTGWGTRQSVQQSKQNSGKKDSDMTATRTDQDLPPPSLQRFMMSPSWLPRMVFDFFGMFLIGYDCLVIPLMVFGTLDHAVVTVMDWCARWFWTVNIGVSFLTGYIRPDGAMEMDPRKAARRYCTTWLPIDALVFITDWGEVAFKSTNIIRVGVFFRVLRLARMVRVVRFVRAPELFQAFFDEHVQSEQIMILVAMLKIIAVMLGANHIIACLWFLIGTLGSPNEARWITMYAVDEMSPGQQYLRSFHWSLAQFAGELMIDPQNEYERFFAVAVLFLAIIGSAAFVSSLTTAMTQLNVLTSNQANQMNVLRRFLQDQGISRPLAARVQQNAQFSVEEKKRNIAESNVELLQLISHPLMVELHYEINGTVLRNHAFFEAYSEINNRAICKVCDESVSTQTIHQGDILFTDSDVCQRMFFIVSGQMLYYMDKDGSPVAKAGKGDFMSEACLWTKWTHIGESRATGTTTRLLIVDAKIFQALLAGQSHIHSRVYAREYVNCLNDLGVSELADLHTISEDELEMVACMAFPNYFADPDEDDSSDDDADDRQNEAGMRNVGSHESVSSCPSSQVQKNTPWWCRYWMLLRTFGRGAQVRPIDTKKKPGLRRSSRWKRGHQTAADVLCDFLLRWLPCFSRCLRRQGRRGGDGQGRASRMSTAARQSSVQRGSDSSEGPTLQHSSSKLLSFDVVPDVATDAGSVDMAPLRRPSAVNARRSRGNSIAPSVLASVPASVPEVVPVALQVPGASAECSPDDGMMQLSVTPPCPVHPEPGPEQNANELAMRIQ